MWINKEGEENINSNFEILKNYTKRFSQVALLFIARFNKWFNINNTAATTHWNTYLIDEKVTALQRNWKIVLMIVKTDVQPFCFPTNTS